MHGRADPGKRRSTDKVEMPTEAERRATGEEEVNPSDRAVPDVTFDHPALLYSSPAEYVAATLAFIRAARDADQPVLVAVPTDNLALLAPAIEAQPQAWRAEVWLTDMSQAGRNPGRILPLVLLDFAARHAGRRVATIGEPVWPGRSDVEYPACVVHEALINTVFAGRDATILCPYDTTGLPAYAIADAHRTHPVIQHGERRWVSAGYADPLRLAAEFNRPLPALPADAAMLAFASAADLPAVRGFTAAWAATAGADAPRIDRLLTAVTELAVNTIAHSGGAGMVRCWSDESALVCQVEDGGHLADLLAGRILPLNDRPGGRGLLMVNALCDLVRVHSQPSGTVVRVWLHL
jgi:anti-sigma regulatory factor (Ser/Thr protein kinase)